MVTKRFFDLSVFFRYPENRFVANVNFQLFLFFVGNCVQFFAGVDMVLAFHNAFSQIIPKGFNEIKSGFWEGQKFKLLISDLLFHQRAFDPGWLEASSSWNIKP
jgi:hypothetical protein